MTRRRKHGGQRRKPTTAPVERKSTPLVTVNLPSGNVNENNAASLNENSPADIYQDILRDLTERQQHPPDHRMLDAPHLVAPMDATNVYDPQARTERVTLLNTDTLQTQDTVLPADTELRLEQLSTPDTSAPPPLAGVPFDDFVGDLSEYGLYLNAVHEALFQQHDYLTAALLAALSNQMIWTAQQIGIIYAPLRERPMPEQDTAGAAAAPHPVSYGQEG